MNPPGDQPAMIGRVRRQSAELTASHRHRELSRASSRTATRMLQEAPRRGHRHLWAAAVAVRKLCRDQDPRSCGEKSCARLASACKTLELSRAAKSRCCALEQHQGLKTIVTHAALSPAPEKPSVRAAMPNNKKLKGKHRQQKRRTSSCRRPRRSSPCQKVRSGLLALRRRQRRLRRRAPGARRAGNAADGPRAAAGPEGRPRFGTRARRPRVVALRGRGVECGPSRGEGDGQAQAPAPNDRQSVDEEGVAARDRRARAIAEARAELEAAQREAADARAKAVEAAESVSKRSSDVEAAQRRAKELGEKCKAATAAIDPEQLKAGLSPDAPSVQPEKEVSYDGTIDVTSTRFAGREVALTISLDPIPDEDAGFVVTLRDANLWRRSRSRRSTWRRT